MSNIWIINQFANTPEFPGHTRQYEIALGLIKKGLNVKVFTSDFNLSKRCNLRLIKNQISLKEKINGIEWYWLRTIPYRQNNYRRYINIFSFCVHLLFRMIFIFSKSFFSQKNYPDLIIGSSPQLPAAFLSLIFSKLINKPFIFEVRDLWPQALIDLGGKSPNNFFIKLLKIMEKILYKNSSAIVILSKGVENYVKARGAKKVYWLPNGPDLNTFKFKKKKSFNKKYSIKNPFLITYTGAHGKANDLSIIIEASKLIIDLPIKIQLIGDGTEKKKLIQEARFCENVEFYDPIPKNNIPEFLANSDAIIICLANINLFQYGVSPNKLYDAYALGLPVITNIDGIINNEVIKYKIGSTAKPGNSFSMAKAIRELYNFPTTELNQMGLRARKLAEKYYSREIIIKKYEKLILKLLNKKNVNLERKK